MTLAGWLRGMMMPFVPTSAGARPPFIRGCEEFHFLLLREKVRADRAQRPMSLVLLEIAPERWDTVSPTAVCRRLLDRVRVTDEVGWFDGKTIGIILPDTPAEGAESLAESLAKELGESAHGLRWRIHSYPDDWYDSGDAPTPSGRSATRLGNAGATRETVPVAAPNGDRSRRASATSTDSRRGPVSLRRPVPLDSPFFRTVSPFRRAIDIVVAGLGLIVVSPLMAGAAIAVRVSSPGPILFRQRRAGLGGRTFEFYKFRTMRDGSDAEKRKLLQFNEQSGPVFKMKNDPRITSVGRILRRTSVDELPQLWNVLRGDMTLIGPRPPIPSEVDEYQRWQRGRLDVPAGLTCLWQVSGRSDVKFEDWVRMDIRYGRRPSLWTDLGILMKTFPAVLSCRGAR
jgi:lipopolysaccharide/colanic/teichoic acid biosynthesis glycosyltransferase